MWAIRLFLLPLACHAWQLSLLHVNDIHARMEETNEHSSPCNAKDTAAEKCFGGLARLVTAVNQVKKKDEAGSDAVVWFNSGDFFQGTLWYTRFKWEMVAKMNNMLDLDAMTLGNHEFDDGADGLRPFLKSLNCSMVVSNMKTSNDSGLEGLYKRSDVLVKNGKRIGLVGYLTPDTIVTANVPADLELEDEVEALTREVAKLRKKNVDIVIALGHSGYLTDIKVAKAVPGIDIIVGAHSHSFLFTVDDNNKNPSNNKIEGNYPTVVISNQLKTVLVVQAFAFTKYLGHIKVNFNDATNRLEGHEGAPILLDNSYGKDPAVVAALEPGKKLLDETRKKKVGESEVTLFTSRQYESTLGNLITDAMLEAHAGKVDSEERPFRIAIHHSGGIRTDLPAGPITLGALMTVLPFETSFETISLEGRFLRQALEKSVNVWEEKDGAFLQMAGIRVVYNLEASVGARVSSALVAGVGGEYTPLEDDVVYPIVLTHYLAIGGDGYFAISQNKKDPMIGDLDTDVVRSYLDAHDPVHPQLEGRICVKTTAAANCTVVSPSLTGGVGKVTGSFALFAIIALIV